MNEILERIHGKLIVSCQALPGNALRDSHCMGAMARAAMLGGAAAIRANGVEDITEIRRKVDIPIIGIHKTAPDPVYPYITPDFEHAQAIASLGIQILALDATLRTRRDGGTAESLIRRIKEEFGLPVMADIATLEEGIAAEKAGADIVATTLSGYTPQSPEQNGPDLALIRNLVRHVSCPVIAEGRFCTPGEVDSGFEAGAFAVVVGKVITNPEFITKRFLRESRRIRK